MRANAMRHEKEIRCRYHRLFIPCWPQCDLMYKHWFSMKALWACLALNLWNNLGAMRQSSAKVMHGSVGEDRGPRCWRIHHRRAMLGLAGGNAAGWMEELAIWLLKCWWTETSQRESDIRLWQLQMHIEVYLYRFSNCWLSNWAEGSIQLWLNQLIRDTEAWSDPYLCTAPRSWSRLLQDTWFLNASARTFSPVSFAFIRLKLKSLSGQ